MPVQRKACLPVIVVALLAGACGERGGGSPDAELTDPSIPGDYSGIFPCSNCPGIRASLRLTASGHFFLDSTPGCG